MSDRMRRVNEAVREVISEAVGELKDPRVGFVTVTGVETSPDLRQATVFVSVLGTERKRKKTLAGLTAAHGVLQARVARELRLKRTPQLTFEYDRSEEHTSELQSLAYLVCRLLLEKKKKNKTIKVDATPNKPLVCISHKPQENVLALAKHHNRLSLPASPLTTVLSLCIVSYTQTDW